MARKPISASLPEDLIARIDRIAELREETRTDVMERMIRNAIDDEEEFLKLMANPVARATLLRLTTSPRFLKTMAMATQEQLTDERLAHVLNARPRLERAGKRQQEERKAKGKAAKSAKKGGSGAS